MDRAGIGNRVEGVNAVAAAVAAGRVTRLVVARSRVDVVDVAAIVAAAEGAGARVDVVDDIAPLATTDAPQGIVAEATPLATTTLEAVAAGEAVPALVVLDHLEDPRNVGAIARSALAAGMSALVVAERRAAPLSATAFKAAAGALERLPVVVVSSVADALARLEALRVWRVGLDSRGGESIFGLALLTEPVALVLGAEGRGLSRLVGERCDVLAHIPLAGGVESLNVSVAAALAMFEVARVRG